ncbi:MAG: DUF350 domain-containing protein [Proteobacteria bacterium]|nr:MAG: DUF350 domain-containing protein [Pseudomonadota bacterium]
MSMTYLGLEHLLSSLVYGVLGFILFMLSLWLMERLTPFSLEKKITEEGNIASGIVVGAIVLSLGIIYAAAIH